MLMVEFFKRLKAAQKLRRKSVDPNKWLHFEDKN